MGDENRPKATTKPPTLASDASHARLDASGTATPKTEIVGVFPAGQKNFYGNAQRLIARPTGTRCAFCRHWKEHHSINGTACGGAVARLVDELGDK